MTKEIGYGMTCRFGPLANDVLSVREVSGPSAERPSIDCTSLDSTGREYLAGVMDGGEVEVTVAWEAGTSAQGSTLHEGIQGFFDGANEGSITEWKVAFGANTTLTIPVLVTGINPTFPLDDLTVCSFTMKATSAIAWPT